MPSKIIRVFGDKCPPSLALNHGHFCSSRNCTGLIFYKLGDISPVTQSFLNEYRTQDSERERILGSSSTWTPYWHLPTVPVHCPHVLGGPKSRFKNNLRVFLK